MPRSLFRFQQPEILPSRDKRIGILSIFASILLLCLVYRSSHTAIVQLSLPQSLQLGTSETGLVLKNESQVNQNDDLGEGVPELSFFFFQPLPVNLADAALLETLTGIGPRLASELVRVRMARGPFHSADELATVPGIGPKRADSLAEKLSFRTEP